MIINDVDFLQLQNYSFMSRKIKSFLIYDFAFDKEQSEKRSTNILYPRDLSSRGTNQLNQIGVEKYI